MATEKDAEGDVSMLSVASLKKTPQKSQEVYSCTVRQPPYAYAQIKVDSGDSSVSAALDPLLARSYCASALQRFLGITGSAITVDILKVDERAGEFWVRVPRPDLGRFSAAITTWPGASQSGSSAVLRVVACGDWLGSLLGRSELQSLWTS
jgi:ribonuclease P/MRP protein subunit POP8